MILGPGLISNCPSCHAAFLQQDLISGNTINGMYFSDGKNHFPMLPDLPKFVRCEACQAFFWLKDVLSEELPRSYGPDEIPPGEDIPYARWPSAEDLAEAIRLEYFRDIEEEEYLRMHLWWDMNNKFRGGRRGEPADASLYEINLRELIRIKLAARPVNSLLLAEMHRELGDFEKAMEYLQQVKEAGLQKIVAQVREKILQKDRLVFMLN